MSPFVWKCRRCKKPHPGGPNFKPWIGPCPACGAFDDAERDVLAGDEAGPDAEFSEISEGEVISVADAQRQVAADKAPRAIQTHSPGVDWILDGGLPHGAAILLAAPPGAGKTTFIFELLRKIAAAGSRCLIIQTEESQKQLARRTLRLGKFPPRLGMVSMTDLGAISEKIARVHPKVACVDSLHDLEGVCDDNGQFYSSGSNSSALLAAKQLRKLAEKMDIAIVFVAHVTKSGAISGSNDLQHACDVPLYLTGKQRLIDGEWKIEGPHRILRCSGKSRFAEAGRAAHFVMDASGLHDRGPWLGNRPPWWEASDPGEGEPADPAPNAPAASAADAQPKDANARG